MIFSSAILILLGLFSFFVISSKNPVHSALSLITVFLLSSILLFSLEVEFLALSFVIVYVGAIAVLFLFVVMMLDIKIGDRSLDILIYGPFGYFISFIFLLEITIPLANISYFPQSALISNYYWVNWIAEIDSISNIQAIGQLLYTYYFLYFLMAGFILFIAILGALMLTLTLNKSLRSSVYSKQKISIST
jgi:NADH-quinone oxidoreductase subunit J